MADLSKTLEEGERIVTPSRRPDGTLRKPIRIRAGYIPQDEVAVYQSKGALLPTVIFAAEDLGCASESFESLASQMNELAVSSNSSVGLADSSNMESQLQDIDKRIRALKKKIRLAEAQQQKTMSQEMKPEQMEKMTKLEGWRQELQLLEGKKAEEASS